MRCNATDKFAVEQIQAAELDLAKRVGFAEDCVEHRGEIAGRRIDDG